ncbi:HTH-type transcriptional repressor PurR [Orchesella cincta]|uniref:HTH-type transcriptional repressor PurR n=1 Tax=Orchesella cincta TaxID=48709 RepID=A0A1D2M0R9_ORCCI|nr:HTH-type transcriptional repressor PurR [Orchesella cincta]
MDTGNEYAQDLEGYGETTTSFFDPRGTSEYCCRLGFNCTDHLDINDDFEEGFKTMLTTLNDAIQSSQVRCSQRNTLFDVYLKHLAEELHLQRPLQLQLTINFDEPLNKTIITEAMPLISDPRDKLWPKAFKFQSEWEDDPWTIPVRRRLLGLGLINQHEDGKTAQMNKKFLEKRTHCDFTLVSGDGKEEEAKEMKCRLDGSTKQGLEALLKFIYYRGETMMGILLAKQSDWWDLELTMNLFLRTRNTELWLWKPLKNKANEVLKMNSDELTSDSNTLMNDLMAKDPKAAKELIQLFSQQDDLD